VRYLSKIANLNLPYLYLPLPCWGCPRLNFAEIFGIRKLETLLLYGVICVMLGLGVLIQYRRVADGRTDIHTVTAYTGYHSIVR